MRTCSEDYFIPFNHFLKMNAIDKIIEEDLFLIGIALPEKTTNENDQSVDDCGALWENFVQNSIPSMIPEVMSEDIYAVYYDYEGDHTQPYSYFIGVRSKPGTEVPSDLQALTIPKGSYKNIPVKGKMTECIADAWKNIWNSDIKRAYQFDFEVYGEGSRDWSNAQLDIFLS